MQVVGNRAYVAAGLQILEIRLGDPQTLEGRLSDAPSFQPLAVNSLGVAKSGLPVAISLVSAPAKVTNGQLVFSEVGVVMLRAEQGGDEFYLPVSAEWSVRITPPEIGVRRSRGEAELYWAAGLDGFKLPVAESLTLGNQWLDVLTAPVKRNGEVSVRLNKGEGPQFFRLEKH